MPPERLASTRIPLCCDRHPLGIAFAKVVGQLAFLSAAFTNAAQKAVTLTQLANLGKMRKDHNSLELDKIKVKFCDLPGWQEVKVLAELALFVCFHAQAQCGAGSSGCSVAHRSLCSFNELQVTLVKRIAQLAGSRQHLLPAATFVDQLFQEANSADFGSKLASAFHGCLPAVS